MSTTFDRAIAEVYDRGMVPLFFTPYARDLVARIAGSAALDVLEIAAGTGAVTRELAATLPHATRIVATDLHQSMLDRATEIGTARPVEWRTANAMDLPFADATFDLVVCQFGVMFFADRVAAYREMRRVLRPGGRALFNTWDRIGDNEIAAIVHEAGRAIFPDDPPRFFERIPHGYFDQDQIRADLAAAGFTATPTISTVTMRSRADEPRAAATALCAGTPLRREIETRDPMRLEETITVATERIAERFGRSAVDAKMQAFVVDVSR